MTQRQVSDHFGDVPAFLEEVVPALRSEKLINRETVVDGVDSAPAAFLDLLHSGAETSEMASALVCCRQPDSHTSKNHSS